MQKSKSYPLINQISQPDRGPEKPRQPETKNRTADRIGAENNISHALWKNTYLQPALDVIGSKDVDRPKILSGVYKISHKNLVALSSWSCRNQAINKRLANTKNHSSNTVSLGRRSAQATKHERRIGCRAIRQDLPAFDPDAEWPGWRLPYIWRVTSGCQEKTKFSMVSVTLKRILKVLITAYRNCAEILDIIKETNSHAGLFPYGLMKFWTDTNKKPGIEQDYQRQSVEKQ